MPIEELLTQVRAEHEALQSMYDAALLEISFLRAKVAAANVADDHLTEGRMFQVEDTSESHQEDTEAATFQHKFACEPLHCSTPSDNEADGTSGARNAPHFLSFSSRSSLVKFNDTSLQGTLQGKAQDFLQKQVVEGFLALVLLLNCVIMWIDTDRRASMLPAASWLEASDHFFLVLYVAEFMLRLFAYRRHVFQDRWTRLDFLIIVIDTISTVSSHISDENLMGGLNISLFRLLRVFRLARVLKILRFVTELQLLIHGLYGAIRAVFFATIMLEIVVLLWCYVLVEMIHPLAVEVQCPGCLTAYSSMWQAHLSLVQQIIAGDSWGTVNVLIIQAHPESSVIFFAVLITIEFAMVNLIMTVIVDAAHRARDEDDQQKLVEKQAQFLAMKTKLTDICNDLDNDGDGELSVDELISGFTNNAAFADIMASLDVTSQDMGILFALLDEDRSGMVSGIEFVNNIYKLKEQDMHTTLMFVKAGLTDLRIKVKEDVSACLHQNLDVVRSNHENLEVIVHNLQRMLSLSTDSKLEGTQTISRALHAAESECSCARSPEEDAADQFKNSQVTAKSKDALDATIFEYHEDLVTPVRLPTALPPIRP